METETGGLFRRVADLDFELRAGVCITRDDYTHEEFLGLRILHIERAEFQKQEYEDASRAAKPTKWSNVG